MYNNGSIDDEISYYDKKIKQLRKLKNDLIKRKQAHCFHTNVTRKYRKYKMKSYTAINISSYDYSVPVRYIVKCLDCGKVL